MNTRRWESGDDDHGRHAFYSIIPTPFLMRQPKLTEIRRNVERFASKSMIAVNDRLLTDNEKDNCNIYGNDVSEMTSSRLFARFMSRYAFYYPKKDDDRFRMGNGKNSSLDAAWAFYENVTLARVCNERKTEDGKFIRAQVGDTVETKLYPYWSTSLRDLNAFGISVRLYFSTVLILGCFLFGAGILNLPLMAYYWDYGWGMKEVVPIFMRASAICDNSEWVPCESCNDEYSDYFPKYRLDGENVLKNHCDFDNFLYPGVHSWFVSLILIVAFFVAFYIYQAKAEIVFDEEVQTTSDYSIKIVNPPKDAYDAEEWRDFFSKFTDDGIVSVSINLNNADLLKTLVKRRKMVKQLKKLLPVNSDINDYEAIKNAPKYWYMKLPFFSDAEKMNRKIKNLNQVIKELSEKEYHVTDVFVIFESERGQRNALHTLSTGRMNVWRNNVDLSKFERGKLRMEENLGNAKIEDFGKSIQLIEEVKESFSIKLAHTEDEDCLESMLRFRGQKVLRLKEAPEPFDVRWKDLQVGFAIRWTKCMLTIIVLASFISWSGFFIYSLSKQSGPAATAAYISATNVIVPKICEFINGFESHATEGKRQASLYIKMALFRCFNSAIALLIVINFTGTISIEDGNEEDARSLLYSVYSVIFAELFTIPVIKLCDFMGNYRKHFLAPRATDQEEMNSCMRGAKFELAERYTDATKVLFVALFYSAILPETYFLGSLACFIHFFFGKFCLLRMWRKAPDIGKDLARLSRNSFFTTSFLVHLLASAYFWSGFPYDFVCESDSDDDDGDYYQFCNQDLFGSRLLPLPRYQEEAKWMSPSQELITSLYGWSGFVLLFVCFTFFIRNAMIPLVSSIFYSTYEPDGKDQRIGFHDVKHLDGVNAYIPQLRENGFEYPLIACDVDSIDHDLFGWRDNLNGFEPHNLTNDLKEILGTSNVEKTIFSIVKYWPQRKNDGDEQES